MTDSTRSFNTLFIIQSLDGKISTGATDNLDVDKDFKRIHGLKEGLYQYYDLERQTDAYSFNTGRVMAKIGVNTRDKKPEKMGCSFIIVDNKPHLNNKGVEYLSKWVKTLYLVTTNKSHPAYSLAETLPNIKIINYVNQVNLAQLFSKLKTEHGIERITIQSGGTLNAELIRQNLIDEVSIVIAPCLIGGKNTPTLMDGESLHTEKDLKKIKSLALKEVKTLEGSYLHLRYLVSKDTKIDPNNTH